MYYWTNWMVYTSCIQQNWIVTCCVILTAVGTCRQNSGIIIRLSNPDLLKRDNLAIIRRFGCFYRAAAANEVFLWASVRLSVCPSVCPSVKCVNCDKAKQTSAHILIPHERKIHLVSDTKTGWWGKSACTWNFGANWPTQLQNASKTAILNRYSLVAAQPLHIAKKFNYD